MSVDSAPAVIETHISMLLFVGDRVIKWYKPVTNDVLDHRLLAARHRACEREVELNRRFAPDVYLDVLTLGQSNGQPYEYGVLMRRLKESHRLSSRLNDPTAPDAIRSIAKVVAVAHAGAERGPHIEQHATVEAVRALWLNNLSELRSLVGDAAGASDLADAASRLRAWVDHRADLFTHRIRGGWIVDGHGDLLCDDIYLEKDGPRILDCLAFRDDLRCGDVVADLAFLAMDLERRGHPELAMQFIRDYAEFSGHSVPGALLWAWASHRAFVRAKVALLRLEQGDDSARDELAEFIAAGLRNLSRAEPRVILIGGPPGTGKSTLANALGERLDLTVLRSDEIRHERDTTTPSEGLLDSGRYAPSAIAENYRVLAERVVQLVSAGESVIADASWARAADRDLLRELVMRRGCRFVEVCCAVEPAEADRRIAARQQSGLDPSEATPAVAQAIRSRFEPWPTAISIDTSRSLEVVLANAMAVLDGSNEAGSATGCRA